MKCKFCGKTLTDKVILYTYNDLSQVCHICLIDKKLDIKETTGFAMGYTASEWTNYQKELWNKK